MNEKKKISKTVIMAIPQYPAPKDCVAVSLEYIGIVEKVFETFKHFGHKVDFDDHNAFQQNIDSFKEYVLSAFNNHQETFILTSAELNKQKDLCLTRLEDPNNFQENPVQKPSRIFNNLEEIIILFVEWKAHRTSSREATPLGDPRGVPKFIVLYDFQVFIPVLASLSSKVGERGGFQLTTIQVYTHHFDRSRQVQSFLAEQFRLILAPRLEIQGKAFGQQSKAPHVHLSTAKWIPVWINCLRGLFLIVIPH
jgi:hypothetical protein